MTQYLLQIHIGPMQEFIAAARRTRDLWFGSWLMSELSKAAARGVAEQAGEGSLIFPATTLSELKPETELAVANKIVALVSNPKSATEAAKKALDQRLMELGKQALDAAGGKLETRLVAEVQIAALPEFYWAAVPLSSPDDYPDVRAKAESLLSARKNCRNFTQPKWADREGKPKSSLDGNRESVIPESAFPTRTDSQKERDRKIKALYADYHARNAERLSGVDLLKRLGKRKRGGTQERFPSTSHMAALPLANQLAQKVTTAIWKTYWGKLSETAQEEERVYHSLKLPNLGDADGSLLFASRLLDYFEKPKNGKNDHSSELANAQQALDGFYEATKLDKPNPYYALLRGDGDSMGKTISTLTTPEAHRQFSQTLAGFAKQARAIIEEKHQGAAVYTGGDDVLALLPLHTMLVCAGELADAFRKMMQEKGYNEATFSAGIAIFHHLEPLEDALAAARKAEKEAKSMPGKNALAIIEAKRSGADRLVKGKWGRIDKRLLAIAAFYQHEQLPHGLAYQLREMALHLGGETAVAGNETSGAEAKLINETVRNVLKTEAGRIIKRKEGSEEAQQLVMGMVGRLDKKYTMTYLVNELIIANTVAQAAEQSGEKLPVPSKEGINGFMDH